MPSSFPRAQAALLAASLALAGCQTTGPIDPSTMSPAEIALRQQETERTRIVQGVATGAVVGALIGGLAGAALGGGNRDAILQGALIGGVGGGVAGGADANRVNQQTRQVAAQQDSLRATIESADKSIAYYKRNVALTSRLVDEQAERVLRNNARFQSGELTVSAYRAELRTASQNIALVKKSIGNADQDIADFDRATANGKTPETLDRKRQLEGERAALRRELARLQETYSRVPTQIGLEA
ncbi:hypothetical protein [Aureimonas psammosilenae]|uniref:hypothetical protein n=1 Tax=Aureimonas psammosilenae TaxID=2495496 RepID=UPI001260B17F|nr:hypothetical protein [Aureimonas psammosilenae]